jgi:hypothetical protein
LEAKLKEGFFVGPDKRKPMLDEDFLLMMTERFHQDFMDMERRHRGRWNVDAGRYIAKFRKPHIRGRATYTATPARKKDSTRPLNKI